MPATHFLSNGRYTVMVTNGGGGYSRCSGERHHPLPRRPHPTTAGGTFFYVRDTESGEVFSAPYNPHPSRPG